MTILVTGAAGFIGAATAARLLERGERVVGVDDFNPYYDPALKAARVEGLSRFDGFALERLDVSEAVAFAALVERVRPRAVVHLAAQAGVRHSIDAPFAYERANLLGHLSVLEACRTRPETPLVYASSSSVYGQRPASDGAFRESDAADRPVSLYAATKRSAELMSAAYSSLYGLRQTGLRFFTVYGPFGRPDMAYFSFTRRIRLGEEIEVYGEGRMARDFTYVDDIVDGVVGVLDHPPAAGDHRIFNIGDSRPEPLMKLVSLIEAAVGRPARIRLTPMQPGDVRETYADVSRLAALTGYSPKVDLETGVGRFVDWHRAFYPDPSGASSA